MDIAALSIGMNQTKVMEQASIAVMKIAMNTGKENAQTVTDMLEKSVDPNVGQPIDVRV